MRALETFPVDSCKGGTPAGVLSCGGVRNAELARHAGLGPGRVFPERAPTEAAARSGVLDFAGGGCGEPGKARARGTHSAEVPRTDSIHLGRDVAPERGVPEGAVDAGLGRVGSDGSAAMHALSLNDDVEIVFFPREVPDGKPTNLPRGAHGPSSSCFSGPQERRDWQEGSHDPEWWAAKGPGADNAMLLQAVSALENASLQDTPRGSGPALQNPSPAEGLRPQRSAGDASSDAWADAFPRSSTAVEGGPWTGGRGGRNWGQWGSAGQQQGWQPQQQQWPRQQHEGQSPTEQHRGTPGAHGSLAHHSQASTHEERQDHRQRSSFHAHLAETPILVAQASPSGRRSRLGQSQGLTATYATPCSSLVRHSNADAACKAVPAAARVQKDSADSRTTLPVQSPWRPSPVQARGSSPWRGPGELQAGAPGLPLPSGKLEQGQGGPPPAGPLAGLGLRDLLSLQDPERPASAQGHGAAGRVLVHARAPSVGSAGEGARAGLLGADLSCSVFEWAARKRTEQHKK